MAFSAAEHCFSKVYLAVSEDFDFLFYLDFASLSGEIYFTLYSLDDVLSSPWPAYE
jgi:hypothetical protein